MNHLELQRCVLGVAKTMVVSSDISRAFVAAALGIPKSQLEPDEREEPAKKPRRKRVRHVHTVDVVECMRQRHGVADGL